jgi:hypothetical protein
MKARQISLDATKQFHEATSRTITRVEDESGTVGSNVFVHFRKTLLNDVTEDGVNWVISEQVLPNSLCVCNQ